MNLRIEIEEHMDINVEGDEEFIDRLMKWTVTENIKAQHLVYMPRSFHGTYSGETGRKVAEWLERERPAAEAREEAATGIHGG